MKTRNLSSSSENKKNSESSLHNVHNHTQIENSVYCKTCGILYILSPSSNKEKTTHKPSDLYYPVEIMPNELLLNLKQKSNLRELSEYNDIFYYGNQMSSPRKKNINNMRNCLSKLHLSKSTLFRAAFFFDYITIKENILSKTKMEQISLGALYLAMKYIDLNLMVPNIKQFIYSYDCSIYYSMEQIRNYEIVCLKIMNYKMDFVIFYDLLQLILVSGILFSNETIRNNTMYNEYNLSIKISELIIESGLDYLKYDQFNIACAIVAVVRNNFGVTPWPEEFINLYQIDENNFCEEYNYISKLYEQKKELTKLKAKITRNSSCSIIKANLHKYSASYMKSTSHYKDKKISYNENSYANFKISFKLNNHNNGNNSNKKNLSQSIDMGDELNSSAAFNSKLLQTNKVLSKYRIKDLHNFTPNQHRSISCINYRKQLNKSQSKFKTGSSNKVDKSNNSNGKGQREEKEEREKEYDGNSEKDIFYLSKNGRIFRKEDKNISVSCSRISSERTSLSKGKKMSNTNNKFHIESYKSKIPNKNITKKVSISISKVNHNSNNNNANHNNQNNSINKSNNKSVNKSKIINDSNTTSKSNFKQSSNVRYIFINNSKLNLGMEKGISNSSSSSNLFAVPSSKNSVQSNYIRAENAMKLLKKNSSSKMLKENNDKTNKPVPKINYESRMSNKKLNRSGTSSGHLICSNRKLSCNEREEYKKETYYDSSNKCKNKEYEFIISKKDKQAPARRGYIIKRRASGKI
ncbi:MAG: hypothetical protein MJ252_13650 [archaeon]|nr:hypothetical protein [archaeon]